MLALLLRESASTAGHASGIVGQRLALTAAKLAPGGLSAPGAK
jgi:hypothetical protein